MGLLRIIAVFAGLFLLFSCGPKSEAVRKGSPSKEEQIAKANVAFQELEVEVKKEAKDLTLEEGKAVEPKRVPRRVEKPKPKRRYAKLTKKKVKTKYPIVDGLPVWVSNPNYGGVLGGVGIAKKIPGKGLAEQRRLAKQIALADLAKQIEVVVKATVTKTEINIDTQRLRYYKKKFESLSEQEVRSLLIRNARIEDEWIDPETGDLYVWVVIK